METILFALLRTTLVLTLCGGLCFLALRKIETRLPRLSRLLWIAVLLTGWFWLQPVIPIPHFAGTPIADGTPVPSATPASISAPAIPDVVEQPVPSVSVESIVRAELPQPIIVKPEYRLNEVIFAVWFGGMVVTIFLAAAGYVRILFCLRNTEPVGDALSKPWQTLLMEHGIAPQTIPMLLSRNLGPALVRTPLGYRLVVPLELWDELSESSRLGILRHELAHFRRRDVWKSFFVRILALPHWFNPIAHYAANRFDELAEQLCDREAFAGQREGLSEFARILLLLHENTPTHFVARHSFFGRNLKRRVASLLENPPLERISIMRKTLLVLGAVAILCAAMFRVEFVATTTAQEPAAARDPWTAPPDSALWTSVIDAETQKPLAGVKATLYFAKPGGVDVDTRITQSDEQGRILFPLPSKLNADMEAGTSVLVEKEGYVSEQSIRQAKWAERFLNEGKMVCDVFPLQKAETITGRFVDEQGRPLTDVLVAVQRQKVKPYGREGTGRVEWLEIKSGADGRFRLDVARNEKIVLWAVPENLAPQYVFPDQKRGDLGNITVEKGFEPVVTVLDNDGRPVPDVWVNLSRRSEGYGMLMGTANVRSALTDQEGNARFRPVSEGDYDVRVSERPHERYYAPWSHIGSVTWRANVDQNKKVVKGVYLILLAKLSAASSQVTLHAKDTIDVEVQFSDKTTDSYREINTNIHARREDGSFFTTNSSSDSPSAYRGEGLFVFQVPIGLEKAMLRTSSTTNTSYRVKIRGENEWLEAAMDFPLGTIGKGMTIDVAVYKSPKITLNVVDESGQPVKEYYAWLEYVDNGTPARIAIKEDKIRIDITPERFYEIVSWDFATSELPLVGILDVSFTYKNFGKDETKINAGGILPDKEMRLHLVGRGYALADQTVPKMTEGEERNLTITLTREAR